MEGARKIEQPVVDAEPASKVELYDTDTVDVGKETAEAYQERVSSREQAILETLSASDREAFTALREIAGGGNSFDVPFDPQGTSITEMTAQIMPLRKGKPVEVMVRWTEADGKKGGKMMNGSELLGARETSEQREERLQAEQKELAEKAQETWLERLPEDAAKQWREDASQTINEVNGLLAGTGRSIDFAKTPTLDQIEDLAQNAETQEERDAWQGLADKAPKAEEFMLPPMMTDETVQDIERAKQAALAAAKDASEAA